MPQIRLDSINIFSLIITCTCMFIQTPNYLDTGLGGLIVIKIYLLATPFSVCLYHHKIVVHVSLILRKKITITIAVDLK